MTLWPWPGCFTYLSKTLTLAISFEWYVLGLWYFSWAFLLSRPFCGYHQIWLCELDLGVFKTLTMPISFVWYILGFWYFTWVLWKVFSKGTNWFDLVTLTFMFDLLTENLNVGCIFWMVCIRVLIFHTSVCCIKAFPWVATSLTLWPWPLCLTKLQKTLTLAISFEWYALGLRYFTLLFLETRPSLYLALSTNRFDLVTFVFDLHIKTLTLFITFE
jgi:hypothetical protein